MDDNSDIVIPDITFSPDDLAKIRAELGVEETPTPETVIESDGPVPLVAPPVRRKRGRPRKTPLPTPTDTEAATNVQKQFTPPAPLTKRDEKQVSERLANILTGGTGVLSMAKPYLAMTEDEAKAIADPLSSYLVRNAETQAIAKQVLENYDLLAIVLGVMAYVVRVYHDRNEEIGQQRQSKPSLAGRVGELTATPESRPEVRETSFISTPNGPGFGFDPNL